MYVYMHIYIFVVCIHHHTSIFFHTPNILALALPIYGMHLTTLDLGWLIQLIHGHLGLGSYGELNRHRLGS